MPILTFMSRKDTNKKLRDYPFEKGVSLTIGRLEDNDVVIRNMAVSGRHAKIDAIDERFLLTDLESKNGTFVNDRPIRNHWLVNGDVILIGKYSLIFSCAANDVRFPAMGGTDSRDATAETATAGYPTRLNRTGSNPPEESGALGILSFLSGGEGEIALFKTLTKIGKNASSDIVVEGILMGQTSATISRRGESYHLSYVGGVQRPRVNGRRVKDAVLLAPFDTIEIGPLKMQFIQGSAADKSEPEPR
jgi:pSer/pThr/pTyr-binding forkhead associated (FHA) protein